MRPRELLSVGMLIGALALPQGAAAQITKQPTAVGSGGGFMVIRTAKGKVTTIDSREESPRTMRPDSFMENGAPLPFNEARWSGLSGGVPGTVEGWERALHKYGTWSFKRVLEPGIDVAREGFVIDRTFHEQAQDNAAFFDDITSSEALYLDPDGTARDVGSVQTNP